MNASSPKIVPIFHPFTEEERVQVAKWLLSILTEFKSLSDESKKALTALLHNPPKAVCRDHELCSLFANAKPDFCERLEIVYQKYLPEEKPRTVTPERKALTPTDMDI